jgi:3-oxoacyl-[acyl-carrier protein] reductase
MMDSMKTLSGQVALVTGSSRGIGAAIARLFAAHGAAVAVHGRDAAALKGVRDEIERTGGRVLGVTAELTRFQEIERIRAEIERQLGPVTVLVANAGGSATRPMPFEEIGESDWRASIDSNLTATFLTLKCFLPGMKARRSGTIITMSSAAARRPHPRSPVAYAAAKAGIQMLTQHVAAQAGPFGIRVNCLAPEAILTERNLVQIPTDVQQRLVDEHPLRRLGTPEDVARAALYLASDEASWITGVILDIAGGAVMSRAAGPEGSLASGFRLRPRASVLHSNRSASTGRSRPARLAGM